MLTWQIENDLQNGTVDNHINTRIGAGTNHSFCLAPQPRGRSRHNILGVGGAVSSTGHVIRFDHLSHSNMSLAFKKDCVGPLDASATDLALRILSKSHGFERIIGPRPFMFPRIHRPRKAMAAPPTSFNEALHDGYIKITWALAKTHNTCIPSSSVPKMLRFKFSRVRNEHRKSQTFGSSVGTTRL